MSLKLEAVTLRKVLASSTPIEVSVLRLVINCVSSSTLTVRALLPVPAVSFVLERS